MARQREGHYSASGPVTFAGRKTLAQITDEGLCFGEPPDHATMHAIVINAK